VAKNRRKPAADVAVESAQSTESTEVKGIDSMPRGIKKNDSAQSGAKSAYVSVYVKFTEPEDIALFERLAADAKSKRYPIDVYITLVLLEAYPAPVEQSV